MKVFKSSQDFLKYRTKTEPNLRPIVALGNFDGVHRAHAKMLRRLIRLGKKYGLTPLVYTFHPHPVKVLSSSTAPKMILTLEQKLELLAELGIEITVIEPFTKKFALLDPEAWFEKVLVKALHGGGILAGYDFTFGSHRRGTVKELLQFSQNHGIHCNILEAQLLQETLISSSQIRRLISQGDLIQARQLLGHPYFIDGKVIRGQGRGKSIGFATANLQTTNELLPPPGVYACQVKLGSKIHSAVTNIGFNPTFGGKTLSIETHLLKFDQNLYKKNLRLVLIKKIREEQKFPSVEALVQQIRKDIKAAQTILLPQKRKN